MVFARQNHFEINFVWPLPSILFDKKILVIYGTNNLEIKKGDFKKAAVLGVTLTSRKESVLTNKSNSSFKNSVE